MIHSLGTGPQKRLSSLAPRLSPIMKYMSGGIVIVFGLLQASALPQGLMNGSSVCSTPLTTGWPFLTERVSPGPATIRLMKFWLDSPAVGFGQGSPAFGVTPHSVPLSAP